MVWDKDLLYTAGEMRGQGRVLLGHMGLTQDEILRTHPWNALSKAPSAW